MGKNFNPRPQCAGCGEFLPAMPVTGEPPWLCSTECASLLTHNLIEEEKALNKATELFGTNMKHAKPKRVMPKVKPKGPAFQPVQQDVAARWGLNVAFQEDDDILRQRAAEARAAANAVMMGDDENEGWDR